MNHLPTIAGAPIGTAAGPFNFAGGIKSGDHVWVAHPVDIRLSLPLPFGRYYLTLVSGPERRTAARVTAESARRGASAIAVFAAFFFGALVINAAAILALLVYSSVLQF